MQQPGPHVMRRMPADLLSAAATRPLTTFLAGTLVYVRPTSACGVASRHSACGCL